MYIGSKRLLPLSSKGDSAFIRYSVYADGTDFTETWRAGQNYIGFATGQTAPTDKSQYTWLTLSNYTATYDGKTAEVNEIYNGEVQL